MERLGAQVLGAVFVDIARHVAFSVRHAARRPCGLSFARAALRGCLGAAMDYNLVYTLAGCLGEK